MYTLKEQQESFIKHREGLMKELLERAVRNNVKVTISFYGGHARDTTDLHYNIGGVNLRFDCNMRQYSYARKRLNEKIKIQRVAELSEAIRKVRWAYHDGQDIISAAILASRRNY